MRFAEFVAKEIREGRYQNHWGFMSNEFLLVSEDYKTFDKIEDIPENRWCLGAKGIFFGASLSRGRFGYIDLTRDESRILRRIWNMKNREMKAEAKAKTAAHEAERQQASWR